MKMTSMNVIAALLFALLPGAILAQNVDLSGTWVGDTVIPASPDKDQLTLVLKKDGASYTGTISDTMGMMNQAALESVKIADGTLSFQFVAHTGEQEIRVTITLKISGDKLVGSWVTESGDTGPVEMERKK
ncbi:MAG: hypothetical protein ABSH28_12510 [Acidobacteriota bacterium]